jgi:asparagine synthase (glutamine-hydrolysing)
MCGIAGIVGPSVIDRAAKVSKMLDLVAHRGPDGRGQWSGPGVEFGHVRLAIVDRSHNGDQPMFASGGEAVIVFNGQIYNHVELRRELEILGRAFRTRSDTEVLLQAYLQWGIDCLPRLNGMWAFALADLRRRRVLCARDRFGVKPLFLLQQSGLFAFASEAKQLLGLAPRRAPDLRMLAEFVLAGLTDHETSTCFEGLQRLGAGRWIEVDLDGRYVDEGTWYSLTVALAGRPASSAEEYASLFDDAVRLRLRSDVPVGTCLSGGLDSSNVAASAAQVYAASGGDTLHAITASSEDPRNDERGIAGRVVHHLGLRWTVVQPTYDDFVASWERMHWHQDEPVGGPSLVMQWYVMQAARGCGLVVMLDGQGGDETLLGYDRYWPALLAAEWHRAGWRGLLASVGKLLRYNDAMTITRLAAYAIGGKMGRWRECLYRLRAPCVAMTKPVTALDDYGSCAFHPVRLAQLEITRTSLPALLRYEDRNSMAHGVEARLPFLDYRVVECALALSPAERTRDGWSKWPLRQVLGRRLPDAVRWRRNKLGFNAPDRLWLPKAKDMLRADIRGSRLVRELFGGCIPGSERVGSSVFWRLSSIACWERIFCL